MQSGDTFLPSKVSVGSSSKHISFKSKDNNNFKCIVTHLSRLFSPLAGMTCPSYRRQDSGGSAESHHL